MCVCVAKLWRVVEQETTSFEEGPEMIPFMEEGETT